MSEITTKPYLLRALYEWCTDNGFTPYIVVVVNSAATVPMEFVKNGEIVLNISFNATSHLKIDNDFVRFKARFGGVTREIEVPVENVSAIYARENGQGMAFEVKKGERPVGKKSTVNRNGEASNQRAEPPPALSAVPTSLSSGTSKKNDDDNKPPEPPKKGGRPTLTRIK
jgi:stringent starvation protein B